VAAGWKSEVWRRGFSRERDGAAVADGEDRGSVAAEAAMEETLLHGEAERRLGRRQRGLPPCSV
jgi:hypothetical protein